MSYSKVNSVLSFVALAALSGSAQAGFVWIDDVSPYGAPLADVSTTNDFRGQLAGSGISQMWLGRSLGVVGADSGDWVSADFFGAEAGYRNQFWADGTLLVDNLGNQSWSARPEGSFNASNGVLDFGFCAVTIIFLPEQRRERRDNCWQLPVDWDAHHRRQHRMAPLGRFGRKRR